MQPQPKKAGIILIFGTFFLPVFLQILHCISILMASRNSQRSSHLRFRKAVLEKPPCFVLCLFVRSVSLRSCKAKCGRTGKHCSPTNCCSHTDFHPLSTSSDFTYIYTGQSGWHFLRISILHRPSS